MSSAHVRPALKKRDRRLLISIALGRSSEEIASEFEVKRTTVKVYIKQLFRKLSVTDRMEAVLVGRELGLLPSPSAEISRLCNVTYTSEEKRLLSLAASGLTYVQMGGRMGYSTRQVKYMMTLIFPKLGVSRRDLAVLKALYLGLIREPGRSNGVAPRNT